MDAQPNSPEWWDARFADGGDWKGRQHDLQSIAFMMALWKNLPDTYRERLMKMRSVCDLGCATGDGTAFLRSFGVKGAWGIDRSEVAIKKARIAWPGIRFECRITPARQSGIEVIDAVVCSNTLEHADCPDVFRDNLLYFSTVLILLVPWRENSNKREPDHLHSFDNTSFPKEIRNFGWVANMTFFKLLTVPRWWKGKQALVVYER
jgi:SAM-dependent methyltransferase